MGWLDVLMLIFLGGVLVGGVGYYIYMVLKK